MNSSSEPPRLIVLALLFLRIGVIGFGGALANMALMEQEWVRQRKGLTQEQFLEGVALSYLLPGPTAVLLSIYLGSCMRGILGGFISGIAFITPAVLLTFGLSWVYFQYHTIPAISALLGELGPVVVALILATLYRSWKTTLPSLSRWGLSCLVGILLVFPVLPQAWNLVTLLLLSGLIGILLFRRKKSQVSSKGIIVLSLFSACIRETPLVPSLIILLSLALTFLKISFLMFGGGIVAIPLFQQELVETLHWLTPQQFLDGVAIGQLTPGPITVVATFAGYAVAGSLGALVATLAMYVPAFTLMLGFTPLLQRLRHSSLLHAMLQGVMAGALGMMGATAVLLGRAAIMNIWQIAVALASLVLLLRWKVSPVYVILGGAILGLLRFALASL